MIPLEAIERKSKELIPESKKSFNFEKEKFALNGKNKIKYHSI